MDACGSAVPRSRFAEVFLEVAIGEIGNGEEGRNNAGPDVARYFNRVDDEKVHGSWCAAFVSYCGEEAARRLRIDPPFKRSNSAKAVGRNVAKASGIKIGRDGEPVPGDLVIFHRGDPKSWKGHVGIVEAYELGVVYTIEGNTGRYPSRVRRLSHEIDETDSLIGFSGMV